MNRTLFRTTLAMVAAFALVGAPASAGVVKKPPKPPAATPVSQTPMTSNDLFMAEARRQIAIEQGVERTHPGKGAVSYWQNALKGGESWQLQFPDYPTEWGSNHRPPPGDLVPKAVLDYFQAQGWYSVFLPGQTGAMMGQGGDTILQRPANWLQTMPPDIRTWVQANMNDPGRPGMSTVAMGTLFEMLGEQQRIKVYSAFTEKWSDALAGSDADLLRAIRTDPEMLKSVDQYSQIYGLDIGKDDPKLVMRDIRMYVENLYLHAQNTLNVNLQAMAMRVEEQKKLRRIDDATQRLESQSHYIVDGGEIDVAAADRERLEWLLAQAQALLLRQPPADPMATASFTSLAFEQIYGGYDPNRTGPAWASLDAWARSPSAAGNSLSSAPQSLTAIMNSLSASGISLSQAMQSLSAQGDPYFLVSGRNGPSAYSGYAAREWALQYPDLAAALYGALWSTGGRSDWMSLYGPTPTRGLYQSVYDPTGEHGRITDADSFVGYLDDATALRLITAGDLKGLDRLLAQPFNVLVTWGSQLYDLDLHMTGPTGSGTDRFHIYYAARGDLAAAPFAQLIQDCICVSGSEVILTTQLNQGGVYRISAFDFGNQSETATQLSTDGNVVLQIVRGGQAVSNGAGTTIVGGHLIFQGSPTPGQAGNTWLAVEIDPKTGKIFFPNAITNSSGSSNVP